MLNKSLEADNANESGKAAQKNLLKGDHEAQLIP